MFRENPSTTSPHTSLSFLIPQTTMKESSHKIDFMGLTTKKKYDMSKNTSSNNLSSSLIQKGIQNYLGNVSFIYSSKELHFDHDKI